MRMSEPVAVPIALLVETSDAVQDAACLPGMNRMHRGATGSCAAVLLRAFGQSEERLEPGDHRDQMRGLLDNLYVTTRSLRDAGQSILAIQQSFLEELAKSIRETATELAADEPTDDVLGPSGWVYSMRLLYLADLLSRVLDDPGSVELGWVPRDWDLKSRHWLAALPDEIDPSDILSCDEIRAVLEHPQALFYVYLLIDRQDEVFYVGKGAGLRILQHESEVLIEALPRFTNWKKLNKIASLIRSGVGVRYVIDSWHDDARSALSREHELLVAYEYHDPRRLFNSRGESWKG